MPTASGACPAATAAAEPEEEPPGVCAGVAGLRVGPGCKKASSVVTVLPRISAPAAFSRATTKASSRGTRPASSAVPFSVGIRAVSMMSLSPTGTPCSGPIGRPVARCASSALAWARTCSGSNQAQARSSGSVAAMRAIAASARSAAFSAPAARRSRKLDRAEVERRLGRRGRA